MGRKVYTKATRLPITADSCGSNGSRVRRPDKFHGDWNYEIRPRESKRERIR
jgi:hypothetical protein